MEAATGLILTSGQIREVGARIVNIERAFNAREEMTRSDDFLPRRFMEERLTEGASAGTVFDQEPLLDEYYSERGWDLETSLPPRGALEGLGLG